MLLRSELATPRDPFILPDVTSKEPLGPVLREDDFQRLKIVKLMQFAMLDADEFGVDQANIDIATTSQKPCVRRLLGLKGDLGEKLGLTKDWVARVIRLVGNYGDVYDRDPGTHSRLGIARDLNSLRDRGAKYAPSDPVTALVGSYCAATHAR